VPKGVRVVDGKGLRVYPGMIDSGTELGLSEIEMIRETVDTGELGEFMPQLRALAAVNPDSEHFAVVRIAGITSVMTFPAGTGGGEGGGGRGRPPQYISGQAALIHTFGRTWEDMAVSGSAAVQVRFPILGPPGGRGGPVPENIAGLAGETGAVTFTEMTRTYQQEVAKLADFFDEARRYQKAKAANLPGFVRDLKYEAMLPVLDGKLPVAIAAATPRSIHDAIQFAEKQNVKIVIMQPRELGSAAAELKAKNIPVILGESSRCRAAKTIPTIRRSRCRGKLIRPELSSLSARLTISLSETCPIRLRPRWLSGCLRKRRSRRSPSTRRRFGAPATSLAPSRKTSPPI